MTSNQDVREQIAEIICKACGAGTPTYKHGKKIAGDCSDGSDCLLKEVPDTILALEGVYTGSSVILGWVYDFQKGGCKPNCKYDEQCEAESGCFTFKGCKLPAIIADILGGTARKA